jgi:hypothetical protein
MTVFLQEVSIQLMAIQVWLFLLAKLQAMIEDSFSQILTLVVWALVNTYSETAHESRGWLIVAERQDSG